MEHNGQFWRSIFYIGAATTTDVIRGCDHAHEVGYGLGMFHSLISDLPTGDLADLPKTFVTPAYLERYDSVLASQRISQGTALLNQAYSFIEARRLGIDVLEAALARGELQHRPIHGDPKINNVMIDESTGQAVGLIDLDTVKPGLVHCDIGDCLRSCNPAGEADNGQRMHVSTSLSVRRSWRDISAWRGVFSAIGICTTCRTASA